MPVLIGCNGEGALALGPKGPMVEEFWDNGRRYAIYVLTVSTGAIYTILHFILELIFGGAILQGKPHIAFSFFVLFFLRWSFRTDNFIVCSL